MRLSFGATLAILSWVVGFVGTPPHPTVAAHELKKPWGGSGDLWVDREGNIVVKQNGEGPGDWTGKNINDY